MQIGLFFGSFNPIHLGHTRLAQYILEHAALDEVWLIVSPNNPLKAASELMDEDVRLQLAKLATQDMPKIHPSDFEFSLPRPNYTLLTLQALSKKYPEHRFSLIIGSDNMAIFDRWRDYRTILRDYPILVYPRKGDDMEALRRLYPMMQVVEGAPYWDISATEIRKKIASGAACSEWLHPDVENFLEKNAQSSTFATLMSPIFAAPQHKK